MKADIEGLWTGITVNDNSVTFYFSDSIGSRTGKIIRRWESRRRLFLRILFPLFVIDVARNAFWITSKTSVWRRRLSLSSLFKVNSLPPPLTSTTFISSFPQNPTASTSREDTFDIEHENNTTKNCHQKGIMVQTHQVRCPGTPIQSLMN